MNFRVLRCLCALWWCNPLPGHDDAAPGFDAYSYDTGLHWSAPCRRSGMSVPCHWTASNGAHTRPVALESGTAHALGHRNEVWLNCLFFSVVHKRGWLSVPLVPRDEVTSSRNASGGASDVLTSSPSSLNSTRAAFTCKRPAGVTG